MSSPVRSPWPDGAARQAITADLGTTLFVEASAGSGKTTQLVARLLRLLVSGRARIDQVAAITFTEAAAAELRDRLAGELERAASVGPDGGPGARAAADALAGLDRAAITTLHGLSRRVLAEHPFDAGLPPVFEVMDEVRSLVDFDERWGELVDRLLADASDARALQWAAACGVRLDALQSIARAFEANWDLVAVPPAAGSPPWPVVDPGAVLRPLRAALDLAGRCVEPDDKLLGHLLALEPWADRLGGCADEIEVLGVLAGSAPRLACNRGRSAAWAGCKDDVLALLTGAQEARERTVADAACAALRRLGAAIGACTRQAAATRRREGRLQFHDLLVLARDMVRDRPEVRAALHEQYRYLLIDEFQDTDPLQAELAMRIASSDAPGADGAWQDLTVDPGRLFFVGDPKQSIYRFRRADVGLFEEVKCLLVDEGLRLATNFRSTPGIVEWVDAVLGEMAGPDGPSHPSHVPSWAARPPHGTGPPVTLLGAGLAPADDAAAARAREADDVAAAVLAVRDEGWPVGEECRPAQLVDVTVLVPTRRTLPALQDAFDRAGIPYRLESSSLVYSAPEVQDLLAILHAVDDPTDERSVVAALRSPGFGCGDDDLLRHRLAGGTWDYRARVPAAATAPSTGEAGGRVAEGLGALRELHDARWWCEVSALVGKVVEDRRLLPLSLDGPQWREAWRRLRFVVDQACQFTESTSGDLRGFLAWVDLQRGDGARVTEVVLPEGDVDAVRVMTVHAAKGLEFPVVVVAGLGGEPGGHGRRVLFGPEGPELGIRKGLATPGYAHLAEQEKALDAAERVRLLYVATTRARDHLVVSVHRGKGGGQSMAARLEEACAGCRQLWRVPAGRAPGAADGRAPAAPSPGGRTGPRADPPVPDPPVPDPPVPDPGELRAREEWSAARARRLGPGAVPGTVAATAVARLAAGTTAGAGAAGPGELPAEGMPAEGAKDDDPDRPAWRRGRAGTAVGRAVHAVLQSVDLATGEGLRAQAAAQAAAEGVPSRAGEVESLARAALGSDVVRTAVAGGRYWRELYVGAPVGPRVVEGFVDLLVEGPEGLEVVDYKTDQLDDLDRVLGSYRLQGAAYAVAVEAAAGRPVSRCTFLFLRTGGAVARDVHDLELAKEQVRAAVAGG